MAIDFNDYLYYDPSSASGLRWKVDRYGGNGYNIKMVSADDVAGSVNPRNNYWYVRVENRNYTAHRVLWEMHHNTKLLKSDLIDHINRVRTDNRISNLRVVTEAINARNNPMTCRNTSGKVGVYFICGGCDNHYVTVKWTDHTTLRQKNKNFPVKKFGLLPAYKMAVEFRDSIIKSMNLQGAGYSETHGK